MHKSHRKKNPNFKTRLTHSTVLLVVDRGQAYDSLPDGVFCNLAKIQLVDIREK